MRLNQIRHFLSIVEAGSIRAAARMLGTSHPALTKSVRQLETELRAQLIQRGTRGVTPTESGRAFLSRARVIQAELRKAEEELAQISGERTGSLAVGLAPVAALMLGPEPFARFVLQHPAARMRIMDGTAAALVPAVRDGTLDLAIGQKPVGGLPPAVKFRVLFRTPVLITARRGHPLRGAKSLAQLAGACWIVVNPPGSGGLLERAFFAVGMPFPRRFIHCESYPLAQALIARTDALMLLPPRVITDAALTQIPVDATLPTLVVGLYTRADSRLTMLAQAMARSISDVARNLP